MQDVLIIVRVLTITVAVLLPVSLPAAVHVLPVAVIPLVEVVPAVPAAVAVAGEDKML